MDRRRFLQTTGAVATGLTATLAGCGGDGDATPTDGGGGGTDHTVAMITQGGDYYFDPIGLYVEDGDTVTWELESGGHSAASYTEGTGPAEVRRIPEGADSWNSGVKNEVGETFQHTLDVVGTYDYFCTPHKTLGMVGRIVVGEPGGTAEGSMPPDGEVPDSQTIVDQGSVSYDEFTG